MVPKITIDVHELPSRHGLFSADWNGERIVKGSRTPFFDAARQLVKRGIDPSAVMLMRSHGSDSLRARVGEAAKWTVVERKNGNRPPNIEPWSAVEASGIE